MIAMIGTRIRPCWLAEACHIPVWGVSAWHCIRMPAIRLLDKDGAGQTTLVQTKLVIVHYLKPLTSAQSACGTHVTAVNG